MLVFANVAKTRCSEGMSPCVFPAESIPEKRKLESWDSVALVRFFNFFKMTFLFPLSLSSCHLTNMIK